MDLQDVLSVLVAPLAIVIVAVLLTRLAVVLIGRFERRFIERADDEAGRIGALQRGLGMDDPARAHLSKRTLTMTNVLKATAIVAIWTIAVLLVLGLIGLPVAPLIAAAGIGGIAIGFGAQSLVKDVISGFFVLLENQYDVGDVVRLGEFSGTVERVDLRTTTLRDIDGLRHVVPNGEIRVSTNYTRGFSRYGLVLPVPYEQDLDRTIEIARAVAEELRTGDFQGVMTEPLNVLGVDDFADSAVNLRMYLQTLPGRQWDVGREYRRRLKAALDAEGMPMRYPMYEVQLHGPEPEGPPPVAASPQRSAG
jgi:small-conductance mechanosensitive channel